MAKSNNEEFGISRETLLSFMATAVSESELENSGKRYANDILFAPPASQAELDFIERSNNTGE